MSILYDMAYAAAGVVVLPVLAIKSLRTGKYRSDLAARFGFIRENRPLEPEELHEAGADGRPARRLLIHCVSVGELLSMRQLIDQLLAADPRLRIIVTTTTDTGTARARELYSAEAYKARVRTYRYPLDFSFAVEAFFDYVRPDAIALVELETWPNFIGIAHGRGIPVCIVNGRLTERSLKRYQLVRPVVAAMLRKLTWLGIQTEAIGERFKKLGAPAERMTILPTLKYDTADLADAIPGADRLAAATGIGAGMRLFVGGSTGPGEEQPLLEMYRALRGEFADLRLAIAPRKPETVAPLLAAIRAAGLTPVQRTQRPDAAGEAAANGNPSAPLAADQVLVLDTLGELKKLYSLGWACFVGRSLVPLGGSDMIEAAALAKPVCFGPHAFNFAEAVELLTREQAAVVVTAGASLTQTVRQWLQDPAAAQGLGQRARAVIAAQRGSTAKYVERLLEILSANTPQCPAGV